MHLFGSSGPDARCLTANAQGRDTDDWGREDRWRGEGPTCLDYDTQGPRRRNDSSNRSWHSPCRHPVPHPEEAVKVCLRPQKSGCSIWARQQCKSQQIRWCASVGRSLNLVLGKFVLDISYASNKCIAAFVTGALLLVYYSSKKLVSTSFAASSSRPRHAS